MDDACRFDPGALSRVKGEIDISLHRTAEALTQFRESGDAARLKLARTLAHQIRGALVMVGLKGPEQLCEQLERILGALEEKNLTPDEDTYTCIEQALAAIGLYLEDLMLGEPEQGLRLLPVYRGLNRILGSEPFRASDLFYPDLSAKLPERSGLAMPILGEDLLIHLKRERFNFQKGLLGLIRNAHGTPAFDSALSQMHKALGAVEETQEETRPFWWVSLGFMDALQDRNIVAQNDAKRLCARIDLQIRRLIEGSQTLAERLMRDALYFISQATLPDGSRGAEVRQIFRLDELLPKNEIEPTTALKESTLRRLRECITATEGFWNKFCAGNLAALHTFAEQAQNCAAATQKLDNPDVDRLGQALGRIATWLAESPARNADNVAMEVATAILLLQNAQTNYRRLGTDYARQADLMVSRLDHCVAGTPQENEDVPLLDDITRRAQERMLIVQVTREIQSCLGQIEQELDSFFRDPESGFDGKQVNVSIKQVEGALSMLGHEKAKTCLDQCGKEIARFAEPGYQAVQDDFASVAHALSMLGLFVDALQAGPVDYDDFVRGMGEETVPAKPEKPAATAPATVEHEIEQKKEETQALLEALRETPDNTAIREELKQNLQSLQVDADLVDDHTLGETAKAALSALKTGEEAPQALDHVLTALAPQTSPEAPAPSEKTLKLVQATDGELEAEFLEIFLEEANEVLASIQEELEKLREDPQDVEALTNIRRGTHTLKGSGRMVGLNSFGEMAWSIEQTLNVWLRQELEVTPEIMELIAMTHTIASTWVNELTNNTGNAPDASTLVAFSERLRNDKSLN